MTSTKINMKKAEENFKICSHDKCDKCKYKEKAKECRNILRAISILMNPEFYDVEHY